MDKSPPLCYRILHRFTPSMVPRIPPLPSCRTCILFYSGPRRTEDEQEDKVEDPDYIHPYGLDPFLSLPDVRGSVAAQWIPVEARPTHRRLTILFVSFPFPNAWPWKNLESGPLYSVSYIGSYFPFRQGALAHRASKLWPITSSSITGSIAASHTTNVYIRHIHAMGRPLRC